MCICPLTGMGADGLDEEQRQTPKQESVTVQVSHTHVTLTKRPNSQTKLRVNSLDTPYSVAKRF